MLVESVLEASEGPSCEIDEDVFEDDWASIQYFQFDQAQGDPYVGKATITWLYNIWNILNIVLLELESESLKSTLALRPQSRKTCQLSRSLSWSIDVGFDEQILVRSKMTLSFLIPGWQTSETNFIILRKSLFGRQERPRRSRWRLTLILKNVLSDKQPTWEV